MTTNSHCCTGFQPTFNVHQNLGMVKKLASTFPTMVDFYREVTQRQLFRYTTYKLHLCETATTQHQCKKYCQSFYMPLDTEYCLYNREADIFANDTSLIE